MLSSDIYNTLYQAIPLRHSVRSYNGDPVDRATLDALLRFEAQIPSLPLESSGMSYFTVNYKIKVCGLNTAAPVKLGSYGVIRRAPSFLAVAAPQSKDDEENSATAVGAAFHAEFMVLWLASRGLGSCWMSGTVNRRKLASSLNISSSDKILACIPFGYPAERPTMVERLMASFAGSASRRPFSELFNLGQASGHSVISPSQTRAIFEAVRLAPSGCNRQPWRGWLDKDGNPVFLFENKTPIMNALDRGIALAHAYIAAMATRCAHQK